MMSCCTVWHSKTAPEDLCRLFLVDAVAGHAGIDRDGKDLCIFQGEASQGDGETIDEAKGRHGTAVGEIVVKGHNRDRQSTE